VKFSGQNFSFIKVVLNSTEKHGNAWTFHSVCFPKNSIFTQKSHFTCNSNRKVYNSNKNESTANINQDQAVTDLQQLSEANTGVRKTSNIMRKTTKRKKKQYSIESPRIIVLDKIRATLNTKELSEFWEIEIYSEPDFLSDSSAGANLGLFSPFCRSRSSEFLGATPSAGDSSPSSGTASSPSSASA